MVICEVKKKLDNCEYIIELNGVQQSIVLELIGMGDLMEGDFVCIHENLLNPNWQKYTQPYAFTLVTDMSAGLVKIKNSEEYMIIQRCGNSKVFKRIYG